ncbi:MAG TPA: NAD(P)-dependent oxidoreductase [Candidatus Eisenbacteria bacterium]|nr:NAD(P)-dependent oxidoreductase [Candidatus Eisenbacteria bacterium]
MKHIIGTGLSGLVGSRIVELLGNDFEFEDISRKTGTDISDKNAVLQRLQGSSAEFVVHMAAYTNVDEAEKDKDLGEESTAWKFNVLGTKNVVEAAETTGKHLVYISTDMVFPGTKPMPERYSEEDATGPVGWYATTKAEAEKVVEKATIPWTIVRIGYPYHMNVEKKGYVLIFKSYLEQGKPIQAISDHYFTPTFIDDLKDVFQIVFQEKLSGIYHAGGKDSMSPYEIAVKVADVFGLDKNLISKTTREEYFLGKAPRAFNLSLSSGKIESLGVKLRGFEEGLLEIRKQLVHGS